MMDVVAVTFLRRVFVNLCCGLSCDLVGMLAL